MLLQLRRNARIYQLLPLQRICALISLIHPANMQRLKFTKIVHGRSLLNNARINECDRLLNAIKDALLI
ncbi:MAG: hypothetical protein KME22_12515 [Hassallia sp. WJT32-NPBG1]|nr:hypothetical protein [Hassallia sp. WJT32-NPBG1]